MPSASSSNASISELFRPKKPKGLTQKNLSYTRLYLLRREIDTNLHLLPLKELYEQLHTDPLNGLLHEQAKALLELDGPNTLTPSRQYGWPIVLMQSLCTGFSLIIWLGAFLCMISYVIESSTKPNASADNLYLGCVLIFVDVTCGFFSFYQNYTSTKIMKTFNSMIPTYTTCIREGVTNSETPVRDLVKGDIVRVTAGDIIPADIRIIESKGFKVDNSSLTGECVAVSRSNTEGTINILESQNVAFFSTECVEGSALGVVLCCGDVTALGRVAGLAARLDPGPSPLAREMRRFMTCISAWALGLGIFIAVAALILGYPFMQTTIFVIGIIVANIPEGLQPTVTAALTLTAKRMVKKNCLVKNLDAVEALGACTTICSDKTGTLTQNKMSVQHIWTWNTAINIKELQGPAFTSAVLENEGKEKKINTLSLHEHPIKICTDIRTLVPFPGTSNYHRYSSYYILIYSLAIAAFTALKVCGALCSNAKIKSNGDISGDASESAILNVILKVDDPIVIRKRYPKVAEIPFNSTNKYQVSVHLDTTTSQYVVVMKGAPECLIERCSTVATAKRAITMTDDIKTAVEKASENLAVTGERVLAFADMYLDPKQFPLNFEFDSDDVNFPTVNLRFLGVMGLMDPPRVEVLAAIQRVRSAGVRVLMITGDHPATARAVALEVGIVTDPNCCVITGNDLRELTPDLLYWTLEKHYEIVFARTSPTQKLQIVEACQRQGQVVAVTGDGVNDAPALKQADIGISMGLTGSQVSKQTADIILMDDNFATIVTGIEEGRKIFDNLKKSLCYILISNVPEICPVFMFILFAIPLPLGVMTILCVDLGTDMWPAVAMSYESAETDVMARPPRSTYLVSSRMLCLAYGHLGVIEFAAGMYAYFFVMAEHGFYPEQLFGIRDKWDNEAVSDLKDSLGQEWTFQSRKELERASQAAYFVAIVITQMMNSVICKTRYNSLFYVGMKNTVLNVGLIFELLLTIAVCYTPGVNTFFGTYPLRLHWWFLALPFSFLMFIFDEFRKYCIREQLFQGFYNDLTYY